ncbi:hypothetical protein M4D71_20680 [Niallia taxi]|uniref:hypothetical protein n=1 Tax=Niallia taxi TaxID=2499688 RepID=UPI0021A85598|nr:hypothetical protein [Niallia taxi]MCT2346572.1 hypothetical protein [Niallia taxi]
MLQRRSALSIISQDLSAFRKGLLEMEREQLLANNSSESFDWLRPMVLVTIYADKTAYASKQVTR